jgi:hypothetical protein
MPTDGVVSLAGRVELNRSVCSLCAAPLLASSSRALIGDGFEFLCDPLPPFVKINSADKEKLLMRHARLVAIALAFFTIWHAPALAADSWDNAEEIPLKNVRALDMPGTQELRDFGSPETVESPVGKVLKLIRDANWPENGLAVEGEGLDALEKFYRRRAEGFSWNAVAPNVPVTLVFFSAPINRDVQLVRIQKKGQRFRVWYRVDPTARAEPRQQLALISVGQLPVDKYWVTFEQLPMPEKPVAQSLESPHQMSHDVCGSFSFDVNGDNSVSMTSAARKVFPLKETWAYKMPGTRDINELGSPRAKDSLVQKALRQIRDTWDQETGMAVQGEGKEALKNFYRIRVDGLRRNEVSAGAPISLVFFTRLTGPYVHLHYIEMVGNTFTIHYRLAPHRSANSPQHLALISVGKLDPGRYAVQVERTPMEKHFEDMGIPEPPDRHAEDVSRSFNFEVR